MSEAKGVAMCEHNKDPFLAMIESRFSSVESVLTIMAKKVDKNTATLNNGIKDRLDKIERTLADDSWWVKVIFKVGVPMLRLTIGVVLIVILSHAIPRETLVAIINGIIEHL